MKRFLVVGFGNMLRGDDGLGPLVAAELAEARYPAGIDVQIMRLPQLDISLIPLIQHADAVIFVDARQDYDDALVAVTRVEPCPAPPLAGHTTHSMGIDTLLQLVFNWYGKRPDCYLVTPKGVSFAISDRISATGRLAAARAVKAIMNILGGRPAV